MDHREEALRLVRLSEEAKEPAVQAALALTHAVLHLAQEVRHGLRDLVYELRS